MIIHVPNDSATIQGGINGATSGDTVLVNPGTYIERINFNGKNITLGSDFLISGDTLYISSTVIDGDSSGTVVTLENGENNSAVLIGFTIRNGNLEYGGAAIYCNNSSPQIKHNIITGNNGAYGSSVKCENSQAIIADNVLSDNIGAGIYCELSQPVIYSNTITGNDGYEAYGIACYASSAEIFSNKIIGNKGNPSYLSHGIYLYGGDYKVYGNEIGDNEGYGIYCKRCDAVIEQNIIYRNNETGIYSIEANPVIGNCTVSGNLHGIQIGHTAYWPSDSAVVYNCILWANDINELSGSFMGSDDFHLSYCDIRGGFPEGPNDINADPLFVAPHLNDFNLCAQSPCIDAGDPARLDPDSTRSDIGAFFENHPFCDIGKTIYVSETGSDTHGDGSSGNPYRSIQYAIDASISGDSIIVEHGTYIENVLMHAKSVTLASRFLHTGDTVDIHQTIIDGDSASHVVHFSYCESPAGLIGFTIQNGCAYVGAGIRCRHSDPLISHNFVQNNHVTSTHGENGAGIYLFYSDATVSRNIIRDNIGNGMFVFRHAPLINNNIITGNTATFGAGVYCAETEARLINNIIAENTGNSQGGVWISSWGPQTILSNNIIRDNPLPEIHTDSIPPLVTYCNIDEETDGEGNINADPLFRNPAAGDFHLMSTACGDAYDSPCIDAGNPAIYDSFLGCIWGLGGERSDMGAYGGSDSLIADIDDRHEPQALPTSISQNYPNPFNPATTIEYRLESRSDVSLTIYNLLGQQIKILVEETQMAGSYRTVWDGTDSEGREVASGIYFYRLTAGPVTETRKMVLLK
jgi:hypothetical protein